MNNAEPKLGGTRLSEIIKMMAIKDDENESMNEDVWEISFVYEPMQRFCSNEP